MIRKLYYLREMVFGLLEGCHGGVAGDGTGQDQLRLIDDQTFETLDMLPLQRYEMAISCLSLSFAEDPAPYYIVGTAYAIPDEQEPSKVCAQPGCCMAAMNYQAHIGQTITKCIFANSAYVLQSNAWLADILPINVGTVHRFAVLPVTLQMGVCRDEGLLARLQGRILILETKPQQHKLHLVSEKETRGAVYTMSSFQVSQAHGLHDAAHPMCAIVLVQP